MLDSKGFLKWHSARQQDPAPSRSFLTSVAQVGFLLQVLNGARSCSFVKVLTHVLWLVRCFCLHRFGVIFASDLISFPANLWCRPRPPLTTWLLNFKRYIISLKKRKLKAGLKPSTVSVVVLKYKDDTIRNKSLLCTHLSIHKHPKTIPS